MMNKDCAITRYVTYFDISMFTETDIKPSASQFNELVAI